MKLKYLVYDLCSRIITNGYSTTLLSIGAVKYMRFYVTWRNAQFIVVEHSTKVK